MPYRVIVWGTGFVGKMVIRELVDHPDFDLVGVIVSDPAKDGVDAGEISGIGPIGIRASRDAAAVLALEADAVAHFGPTAMQAQVNIEDMSRALRAGKNVVSTAMTPYVYPKTAPETMLKPIEDACRDGGTTCFTTGIDPGFANDLLPMTLMGLTGRVDRIRIQEILDYASYPGDYSPMGLGDPADKQALLENPAALIFAWGPTLQMIADAIGIEFEKVDTVWEKWPTPEKIEFQRGVIEPGCTAAVRFEIRGWVGGEPRVIIEHCNRITNAAAPDWPRAKLEENDAYRVIVDGSPNIVQETTFRGAYDGDPNAGGCLSTGMRAINAIPFICDAEPGVISALDLPLIPGHGTIR